MNEYGTGMPQFPQKHYGEEDQTEWPERHACKWNRLHTHTHSYELNDFDTCKSNIKMFEHFVHITNYHKKKHKELWRRHLPVRFSQSILQCRLPHYTLATPWQSRDVIPRLIHTRGPTGCMVHSPTLCAVKWWPDISGLPITWKRFLEKVPTTFENLKVAECISYMHKRFHLRWSAHNGKIISVNTLHQSQVNKTGAVRTA